MDVNKKMEYILSLINELPQRHDVASPVMKVINEFTQLCIEYQKVLNAVSRERNAAVEAGMELQKINEVLRARRTVQ